MNASKISPLNKRRMIDFAIFVVSSIILSLAGAGLVAPLVLVPFAIWNFHDGKTRASLRSGE